MMDIEQYSERLGSIAANLLMDQLAVEKKGGNYVVEKVVVAPKLIVRQSSLRK